MAKYLLLFGVPICAKCNGTRYTALAAASSVRQLKIVQWLLTKGTDVNRKLDSGQTALRIACKKRNNTIVQLLIENDAIDTVVSIAPFIQKLRQTSFRESQKGISLLNEDHNILDRLMKIAEILKCASSLKSKSILDVLSQTLNNGLFDMANDLLLKVSYDNEPENATILIRYGPNIDIKDAGENSQLKIPI